MDFFPVSRLRGHMDKDTSGLIAELCARIGMLMEDISMEALTLAGMSGDERKSALERIGNAVDRMAALAAAAKVLNR